MLWRQPGTSNYTSKLTILIANLILEAFKGNIYPVVRHITLNNDTPSIRIGRASKSPGKNLSAAVDNAWFDSPVMSRDHAKIAFNPGAQVLTIMDIGSMHGTFLNDERLDKGVPSFLRHGDILELGAEVNRSDETFPACAFQVTFEMFPINAQPSRGYRVPESDIEDEEEEENDFSDIEDTDVKKFSSSDDDVSIESIPCKATQLTVEPIDFTHDDDDSDVLIKKSTRSSPLDSTRLSPVDDCPSSEPPLGHFRVPGVNYTIILDSDDGYSTGSDKESDIPPPRIEDEEEDEDSMREGSFLEEIQDTYDDGSDIIDPHEEPVRDVASANEGEEDGDEDTDSLFGADGSECYASDVSLSEVGMKGLRALFHDGLLDKQAISSSTHDFIQHSAPARMGPFSPNDITKSSLCKAPPMPTMSWSFCDYSPLPALREPSPSDAAMARSDAVMISPAAIKRSASDDSSIAEKPHCNDWFAPPCQSLGAEFGKHDFFEARYFNKTQMITKASSTASDNIPPPPVNLFPTLDHAVSEQEVRPVRKVANPRGSWARRFQASRESSAFSPAPDSNSVLESTSIPAAETTPYLYDHAQAPSFTSPEFSPEPDLTSAVRFNESKAQRNVVNQVAISLNSRSKLSISDIIDGTTEPRVIVQTKRKAGGISHDAESNPSSSREWTSAETDILAGLAAKLAAKDEEAVVPVELVDNVVCDEARPAKRMKRFSQGLGLAAIGGAAIGGAIVSYLTSAAPDYLAGVVL
ncbi:hypothetical protein BJ878DRAFT_511234 [Calycina marina]|uniref:FHA domain-containing protein n=1 Tax=Calycina marina TaxID=1763456 RepID=A0A9P7Z142_9HELO|nr:hypothetical protein BJ878DRAFT_511234 [Calycina marina]